MTHSHKTELSQSFTCVCQWSSSRLSLIDTSGYPEWTSCFVLESSSSSFDQVGWTLPKNTWPVACSKVIQPSICWCKRDNKHSWHCSVLHKLQKRQLLHFLVSQHDHWTWTKNEWLCHRWKHNNVHCQQTLHEWWSHEDSKGVLSSNWWRCLRFGDSDQLVTTLKRSLADAQYVGNWKWLE